jgi:hypothetical protein
MPGQKQPKLQGIYHGTKGDPVGKPLNRARSERAFFVKIRLKAASLKGLPAAGSKVRMNH